ncbi:MULTISPECIES: hypothetical protein [unclassified Streptomyces]|uniref:hypothetical protein n=1 Tax=unclassified Streptomyces TaxID=2593676 RepID=UPI0040439139
MATDDSDTRLDALLRSAYDDVADVVASRLDVAHSRTELLAALRSARFDDRECVPSVDNPQAQALLRLFDQVGRDLREIDGWLQERLMDTRSRDLLRNAGDQVSRLFQGIARRTLGGPDAFDLLARARRLARTLDGTLRKTVFVRADQRGQLDFEPMERLEDVMRELGRAEPLLLKLYADDGTPTAIGVLV